MTGNYIADMFYFSLMKIPEDFHCWNHLGYFDCVNLKPWSVFSSDYPPTASNECRKTM